MFEKIEMDKFDFFVLLGKLDLSKAWGFKYVKCGNDPMTSRYWVKHSASYEFYLTGDNGEEYILVCKNHCRTHDEVESALLKKYKRWANEFKEGKTTLADIFLKKYGSKKRD